MTLDPAAGSVRITAPAGIGEVRERDDLAVMIVTACRAAGIPLGAQDIVCVSSKVVSKALGLTATDREAAIAADTRGVVAARQTPRGVTRVVRSAAGPVMAAAGVDESNTGPDGGVLRLPADPDHEARALRRALGAALGMGDATPPAVIITDTAGRPWRDGQTDFALGVAGLDPVDDPRGRPDADGRVLEVTVRALADELAAAADLVKGKLTGCPVAVIRGLDHLVTVADGPGAARLVRDPADDWFGLGDVEAVHRAMGLSAADTDAFVATLGAPPARLPGRVEATLRRAVAVARAGRGDVPGVEVGDAEQGADGRWLVRVGGRDAIAVGGMLERLMTAAGAERLDMDAYQSAGGRWVVAARAP